MNTLKATVLASGALASARSPWRPPGAPLGGLGGGCGSPPDFFIHGVQGFEFDYGPLFVTFVSKERKSTIVVCDYGQGLVFVKGKRKGHEPWAAILSNSQHKLDRARDTTSSSGSSRISSMNLGVARTLCEASLA